MDKSRKIIGSRIRIKPDFLEEVRAVFQEKKISPIREVKRDDGDITFEVEVLDNRTQFSLIEAIPKKAFALSAILKNG